MKVMNGLDLQSQKIINLADPSATTDAATKQYVDNVARGLNWKDAVRAATTAAGTLASSFANGSAIDGVTLVTGDRILIKNQAAGAENGIYTVNASGAPTRAVDADTGTELRSGTTVSVSEGTTNGDKAWMITTDGTIVIGTTATTWSQLGGGTSPTAGNTGISVAGNAVSAVAGAGIVISSGIAIDTSVVARKFSANIGNGASTSIAVTHSLGTKDVSVTIRTVADDSIVLADVVATDTNNVTVTFATAPASNAYRVTVLA